MEYPILISGQRTGSLSVEQQGLFTVFEAQCAPYEGILRLSVYGGGREGYLGVMQPWSEGLYLRRKLSRKELEGFPAEPEYAAEAGLALPSAEKKHEHRDILRNDAPSDENDVIWLKACDGSLRRREGDGFILALPARLRRIPRGAVLKYIEGQPYLLFRY